MLEGKTIESVEMDDYGRIILETTDGDVAAFWSDTVDGDSQMTCVTLHVNGEPVFPRAVAQEPAGS